MQPILPHPSPVVMPLLKHASCLHTQQYIFLAIYSISQSCIENILYKLNALAFNTQKLYLKGSTHSQHKCRFCLVQSSPKPVWRWYSVCIRTLDLFSRGPPNSLRRKTLSGTRHDQLSGEVISQTWRDGAPALRQRWAE